MNDKFSKAMFDVASNWKTKDKILEELKKNYDVIFKDERDFRKAVENYNKEFEQHYTNGYYIAHGNKGYKITKCHDEMRTSDIDLYKRSMKMLRRVSRNKQARGEDMNLFMEEVLDQIKKSNA